MRCTWDKAVLSWLRGRQDEAYEHLLIAFSSGWPAAASLDRTCSQLHWNELPDLVLAKQRLREHLNEERNKLLAVACSNDGFAVWRPSPETCATNTPI